MPTNELLKTHLTASACHEIDEPLIEPTDLRAGCRVLNRQRLSVPQENLCREVEELLPVNQTSLVESNVLLVVFSNDPSHLMMLKEKINREIKGAKIATAAYSVSTSGEQLYNDMGTDRLVDHVEAAIKFLAEDREFSDKYMYNIGTVIIGAVETYIQLSSIDRSGAEFGLVMLYNTRTKKSVFGTTSGVPVEIDYLEEARREGNQKNYGQTLRRYFDSAAKSYTGSEGFDIAKDWHRLVCGISMYRLLTDVTRALKPIL